jgi:hypothetical protein
MNNTQKSFKGPPTTNNFLVPTPDASGNVTFGIQGTGVFQRVSTGTYGGYTIQPTDVVYKYDLGVLGCHYHGYQMAVTAGQTYTFSFDYMISSNVAGYPSTNYLANIECYETSSGSWVYLTGNSIGDPTTSIVGVWKTATFSLTIPSSTTPWINLLLYPGACGSTKLADSGYILYKNPQVEVSSFPTPFVQGSRSSTQSILEPIGNNTITPSLVYNSDGTYNFNGTSNYLYCASPILPTGSNNTTVLCWCKPDSTGPSDTYTGLVCWGGRTSSDSRLMSMYTSGTTMYVSSAFWGNDWVPQNVPVTANAWNMVGMISRGAGIANNVTLLNANATGFTYATGSSGNYATPLNTTSVNLTIGCTDVFARFFKGQISEVLIYNRELSLDEIKQNYNALRSRYGI